MRAYRSVLTVAFLVLSSALATAFAAVARTDRLSGKEHYRQYGELAELPGGGVIYYLPLRMHRDMQEEFFYRGRERALTPLLDALAAKMAALGCCKPLEGIGLAGVPVAYVGSAEGEAAPPEAMELRAPHEKYPPMVVHLEHASRVWREALDGILPADAAGLLSITLGFAEYPRADRGAVQRDPFVPGSFDQG